MKNTIIVQHFFVKEITCGYISLVKNLDTFILTQNELLHFFKKRSIFFDRCRLRMTIFEIHYNCIELANWVKFSSRLGSKNYNNKNIDS